MSYLPRGPVRSMGIDSKANAPGRRKLKASHVARGAEATA